MKNNPYIPLSLVVGGLFLFAVTFIGSDIITGRSLTAAAINSIKGTQGVKYPVTAEYSQSKTSLASNPQNGQISPSASFADNVPSGYIVELAEQSITSKSHDINQSTTKSNLLGMKSTLMQQKTRIVNQQNGFINSLQSSVKTRNSSRLSSNDRTRKFSAVLNGVVLDMTKTEADAVKNLPNVKKVEPVETVKALLMDSVPLIHAPQVWAGSGSTSPSTGKGIVIAIIDTGVDYKHPDLGGCFGTQGTTTCKVAGGWDFVNNDADPMDDMGHGTHVASIAAGKGALNGVAPDATIYAYKVLDSSGSGSSANIIAALERAADPNGDGDLSDRADIASLSLGGYGNPDDEMSTAVDNAVAAGVVVTVAAGNSGSGPNTIGSPGTARNAITVAASDKSDNLAYFSSRGPVMWVNSLGDTKYLVKPDVTAPGVNICAARWDDAFPQGDTNCNHDNDHVAISGTSMATPHVAGEAALLLQLHRDWTPAEVKAAIRNNAIVPPSVCPPGYTCSNNFSIYDWGYGRIDALNLVKSQKLPIAQLSPLGVAKGSMNISGTAMAANFANYKLSYGQGQNPTSFTDLYSSNQPVNNRILFSNLDTTALNDGQYTVKLVVTDTAGNSSTDEGLFEVKNITITNPQSEDIYKPEERDVISISGTISGSPSSFTVEYQADGAANWTADGIHLTNGGHGGINNAVIATWDTSRIEARGSSGFYNLRVTAHYGTNTSSQIVSDIYFDTSLHTGWPVHIDYDYNPSNYSYADISPNLKYFTLPSSENAGNTKVLTASELKQTLSTVSASGYYYWPSALEPVADDINNDGKKEVMVMKGGNPPKLMVYSSDGNLLWSKSIGTMAMAGNIFIPLVGDVNNDGHDDVVVYGMDTSSTLDVYAYSYDGTLIWHKALPMTYGPTMLMADLDKNGSKEIVIQGTEGTGRMMYILNGIDGSVYSQWSLPDDSWGASIPASPSVGNFDSDSDLEIVSIAPTPDAGYDWNNNKWINKAALYVYNKDGSVLPGFPVILPGSISSSPVTGDINGDGKDEIVVGLTYASDIFPDTTLGGLYAIDRNGHVMPGWPVLSGYNFWSTPSLSDIKGDGNLEIGASRLGFSTYLFDFMGNVLPGWPTQTCWNDYYSSIMSDINNDGKTDVLTTAGNGVSGSCKGVGGVYAWTRTGGAMSGFPKLTESDAQAFASVSDLDGNGKLNLVTSSDSDITDLGNMKYRGSVYAWDLGSDYNASSSLSWPTFKRDNQRTGMYKAMANASTTPYVPSSVSIVGTSTLAMAYSGGAENVLTSIFHVKVNAGSEDQKIDKNYAFNIYAKTDTEYSQGGTEQYSQPAGTTDDGNGFYVIPAGTSATFIVQSAFNPKSMFAGAYYGILDIVRLGEYPGSVYLKIPAPNTTNTVVIVGEVSPYINSISPNPVPANRTATIYGVRLAGPSSDILTMSGSSNKYTQRVGSSNDGKTIQFTPNVPPGDYYIQVTHPTTGMSNGIVLSVTAPTTPPPPITVYINGSPNPQNVDTQIDQGYQSADDPGGDYLSVSWSAPGATGCSYSSGTGNAQLEGGGPSSGTKIFSAGLEDGDTIEFVCDTGRNTITYHFPFPTPPPSSPSKPPTPPPPPITVYINGSPDHQDVVAQIDQGYQSADDPGGNYLSVLSK
jgi:subtilisin family serine protease